MPIHEVIALIILFLWLTLGTIWDLRSKDQKIPLWFSLVLLLPGLAWLGYFVSPWAALLMAVSIASAKIYPFSLVLGSLGLFAPPPVVIFISPQLMPLVIGWGILVTLWILRVLCGADAMAGLSLLLFFPTWPMAVAILAGILCWSIALLWVQYRKDTRLRLWTVLTSGAARTQQAGLGAYALAVLFYGVFRLWVGGV